MLFVSPPAVSGFFGYDSYEECRDEEVGKLMTRWINPLSQSDARLAARAFCKKYPTKKELKLRSMSLSELRAEKEQLIKKERECKTKHPGSGHSAYWDRFACIGVGYGIKEINIEINRRGN